MSEPKQDRPTHFLRVYRPLCWDCNLPMIRNKTVGSTVYWLCRKCGNTAKTSERLVEER